MATVGFTPREVFKSIKQAEAFAEQWKATNKHYIVKVGSKKYAVCCRMTALRHNLERVKLVGA